MAAQYLADVSANLLATSENRGSIERHPNEYLFFAQMKPNLVLSSFIVTIQLRKNIKASIHR